MDNQYKGLGITSMVLGIVSILLCWTVVMSGLCAVVGAGLGVYYLSKRKQERGFAIAGIATSAFGLILSIFAVAMILIAGTMETMFLPWKNRLRIMKNSHMTIFLMIIIRTSFTMMIRIDIEIFSK